MGGLFLFKLYFKDLWFMSSTMLNLRDTEETDLFVISLNEEERDKLTKIYKKIYVVAADLVKKNKALTISLGELIYEISRVYPRDFTVGKQRMGQEEDEDTRFPESGSLFN